MALFFDAAWFDARLEQRGAARADLAVALGLSLEEVNDIFKDQRELSRADVEIIAQFVGADAETVADKAGIATPRPSLGWRRPDERGQAAPPFGAEAQPGAVNQTDLAGLRAQLDRIEAKLDELIGKVGAR